MAGTRGPLDEFDCHIICNMEQINGRLHLGDRVVFTLKDGQKVFAQLGVTERQALIESIRWWHNHIGV